MPASNAPARVAKFSLTLPQHVFNALQAEAKVLRRETPEHIQRILSEHTIAHGLLPHDDVMRLEKTWSLVDRAVEAAKELCRKGQFSRSITFDAITVCMNDPAWVADYRDVIGDDIFKTGVARKGPVNRELGYRIKAGIGGEVEKDDNGKPGIVKVLGAIIQSYTPMASFDPEAVLAGAQ